MHHSNPAKAGLPDHRDAMEVLYLPPCSSERNPNEYLDGDLKRRIHGQSPAKDAAELTYKARSGLRAIQLQPALVRS